VFIVFTLVREHEQTWGVRGGVAPALGLGSGAYRDRGADRTSASASASPTFLDNDPICEVIPTRLLNEEPGFCPTKYTYWHSPGVGDNNATFDDTSIATGKTDGEDSAKSDKGPRRK